MGDSVKMTESNSVKEVSTIDLEPSFLVGESRIDWEQISSVTVVSRNGLVRLICGSRIGWMGCRHAEQIDLAFGKMAHSALYCVRWIDRESAADAVCLVWCNRARKGVCSQYYRLVGRE
jgi:hypothetical protein